jgi:hypothetical protein
MNDGPSFDLDRQATGDEARWAGVQVAPSPPVRMILEGPYKGFFTSDGTSDPARAALCRGWAEAWAVLCRGWREARAAEYLRRLLSSRGRGLLVERKRQGEDQAGLDLMGERRP